MPHFRSIRELIADAKATARRFPWALICAAMGSISLVIYVDLPFDVQKEFWRQIHVAMIAALGLTGFMSIRLYSETHRWSAQRERVFNLAYLAILVAYFLILPQHMRYLDFNRYGLINANLHLLVAIAPFLLLANVKNAFWQYNKQLFIRFALAFIYSNTIFIGLTIAMSVADHLFTFIKFEGSTYSQLWFLVVGIFNTWFFLKGVPENILELEGRDDYPRGLRIFTQFVLIPLVVLYMFILYMYMAKIIAAWNLPRGWLSAFILGVSIMGLVTVLLVHPLRESENHGWIRFYSKYFYLALFPLIVLMTIAIGVRIHEYGITEQRYFVLLFSLWLLLLAIRFSIRPSTDIRTIPFTLFVLVAIATWGPWSAMSVSKWDQTRRLKEMLTDNGLMKDGRVIKAGRPVDYKISGEISNIAAYLEQSFGLDNLKDWAPADDKANWKKISAHDFVTNYLGLEYSGHYYGRVFSRGYETPSQYFNFNTKQDTLKRVAGFDFYAQFYLYGVVYGNKQTSTAKFSTEKGELVLNFDAASGELTADFAGRVFPVASLTAQRLKQLVDQYGPNKYDLEPELFSFNVEEPGFRARLIIANLNGQIAHNDEGTVTLTNLTGEIMFSLP
jgi:hypothetical protein